MLNILEPFERVVLVIIFALELFHMTFTDKAAFRMVAEKSSDINLSLVNFDGLHRGLMELFSLSLHSSYEVGIL